ncbi:hypothetical protein BJ875DRAFT_506798 [Amylocarpus encephaloides]|uniref:Uncharacterized protein n=1 Tax=Amylocarpus encephaloides TaxID=45428 RepID=A0A9P7YCP4_9HELO|nr:hypothetical protein BJ875DRAFT_506798 [Amylocarpus encephaloides]
MACAGAEDSPLSITASIAGILTFLVAIVAALYVRLKYLRDADTEYFQVKASLAWYKTESTWMKDLINSSPDEGRGTPNSSTSTISGGASAIEHEMYAFVMEQLGKLEERLLELLTDAEDTANRQNEKGKEDEKWTIVPEGWRGRTGIAMTWLPVRAKALELVRQRDALASRVLFAQMSMISS